MPIEIDKAICLSAARLSGGVSPNRSKPLKGTGHLTRYGLTWFADLVFGGGTLVTKRNDVAGTIKEFIAECETDWEKSRSSERARRK